jgi:hypothetical protein
MPLLTYFSQNSGGIDIGADSGAEESEDEEWNYIEVKDKRKDSFGSTDILEPSSALNNLDTYMDVSFYFCIIFPFSLND